MPSIFAVWQDLSASCRQGSEETSSSQDCSKCSCGAGADLAEASRSLRNGRMLTCWTALLQLLRIEEGGAFAGLVGGSPAVAGAQQRHGNGPLVRDLDPRDARFVTELVAGKCAPSRALRGTCMQHAGVGRVEGAHTMQGSPGGAGAWTGLYIN